MLILFAVGGVIILLITLYDVMWTTLSASETGPISFAIMTFYKKMSKIFKPLRGVHRILRTIGLATFLTTIFTWYFLFWVGWWMIFMSSPTSVIHAGNGNNADPIEKIYFTGWLIFTAGIGDYKPQTHHFQIITALGNCFGLFLVAITVSYLISATDAVTRQRQLAGQIGALGDSPVQILANAWDGEDIETLDSNLRSLADDISQCAQQLIRFPLIFNFHSIEILYSPVVKIVLLDETLTIIECYFPKKHGLSPLGRIQVRNAVNQYINALKRIGVHNNGTHSVPPLPSMHILKSMNIPLLPDREGLANMCSSDVVDRRKLLQSLVIESTRNWNDVYLDGSKHDHVV